ncbi:MAG: hypothetical protein ACRDFB_06370 [Rhabdochlamydiaceae bacterium]
MSAMAYTPSSTYGTTRGSGGSYSNAAAPASGQTSGASGRTSGANWSATMGDNPLFWLLVLILILTGYIVFKFTAGGKVGKRIGGNVGVKV